MERRPSELAALPIDEQYKALKLNMVPRSTGRAKVAAYLIRTSSTAGCPAPEVRDFAFSDTKSPQENLGRALKAGESAEMQLLFMRFGFFYQCGESSRKGLANLYYRALDLLESYQTQPELLQGGENDGIMWKPAQFVLGAGDASFHKQTEGSINGDVHFLERILGIDPQ